MREIYARAAAFLQSNCGGCHESKYILRLFIALIIVGAIDRLTTQHRRTADALEALLKARGE